MSVSGSLSPVPTSASTVLAASSAPARRGTTCWVMANPALGWSGCPVMRVTHTATDHHSPLLSATTSTSTTTWPLRATTPTPALHGCTTGAVAAEGPAYILHSGASPLVRMGLCPGVAAA